MNKVLTIKPPAPRNSCYEYTLMVNAVPVPAYVTYDLCAAHPRPRDLLLIHETLAAGLLPELPKHVHGSLDDLRRMLSAAGVRSSTRIGQAKTVVNQIARDEALQQRMTVAVDTFGPVPVARVDGRFHVEEFGSHRSFSIGVYPAWGQRSATMYRPEGLKSRPAFVRSMRLGFDQLVVRYLEDIGELLYDIEHHCPYREAVSNARRVETALRESLDSKLLTVLKGPKYLSKVEAINASMEIDALVQEYNPWVSTAKYAALFVRWALSRFYEGIGFKGRVLGWDHKPLTSRQFESLLHKEYQKLLLSAEASKIPVQPLAPGVVELHRGLTFVCEGKSSEYGRIVSLNHEYPSEFAWVRHLLGFLAYAEFLNLRRISPKRLRLFFSGHHEVSSTSLIWHQINSLLEGGVDGTPQLLRVNEKGDGAVPVMTVRATISQADSVFVIVPKSTVSSAGSSKDFAWIAREMEHGALLDRRIVPMVHPDADMQRLLTEVRSATEFLAPRYRETDRMRKVLFILSEKTYLPLDSDDIELDADTAIQIRSHLRNQAIRRAHSLAEADLARFPPHQAMQLARINASPIRRGSEGEMARRIDPRNPQRGLYLFRRLLKAVDRNPLVIDGREYPLVAHASYPGKFAGGLAVMVGTVLPNETEQVVSEVCATVLKPYLPEVGAAEILRWQSRKVSR